MFRKHTTSASLLYIFIYLIFGVLLFSMTSIAHAQSVPRFEAREISLDIKPVNPEAFQEVTISLETFAIDLNLLNIIWTVDDKASSSGFGKKSITVRTGKYGEPTRIKAEIISNDGRIVSKSVTLYPATVDILWEAYDSYVPPFYQGKALPSRQSIIKASAIPNLVIGTTFIKPYELDYTWKWGYRVKDTSSGFNKQFMAIKNLFTNREEVLSVDVQNTTSSVRGTGEVKVKMREPEILFYNLFPGTTQIDLSHTIKKVSSKKNTSTDLAAIPYFFSTGANTSVNILSYDWTINGESVKVKTSNKNIISVSPNSSGRGEMSIFIQHPKEDFQYANNSIEIISQ